MDCFRSLTLEKNGPQTQELVYINVELKIFACFPCKLFTIASILLDMNESILVQTTLLSVRNLESLKHVH